ncbi:MAG: DMT family transporter [Candidatus Nanopelagicales bacterium]
MPALVTIGLGAVVSLQSRANGELSRDLGTGFAPALLTMVTGFAVLVAILAGYRRSRAGLAEALAGVRSGRLPGWILTGGVFGALFLVVQSMAVPLVGVAVFSVGVVAGQTTGSLLADRAGLSPSGVKPISANRIVAAVLAIVAVSLAISNRLESASGVAVFAALAFVAGALIAPQQSANGWVSVAAGSPFSAATVNFAGGAAVLSVVVVAGWASGAIRISDPVAAPWWAYLGGVLGLCVVAGAAWVVPMIGVLLFSLLSVFGQLAGALVLDAFLPTAGTSVGWQVVAGVGLTFVAVLIAAGPLRDRTSGR